MTDAVVAYKGWGSLSQAWNTQSWNTVITTTKTVTVVSTDSGNKYFIDGVQQLTLVLARETTYVFDVSDSSVSGHPFRFSTTSDGTHGGGSEYTSGVTVSGSAGSSGATVTFAVPHDAPDTLYYYCTNHSGMGGSATIYNISVVPVARTATSGAASVSGATTVTITTTDIVGTGGVGTANLDGTATVTISGIAGTGGVSSVSIEGDANFTITTTDIVGTGVVNGVTIIGDANIPIDVTGVSATAIVGVGFVWGLNVPSQDPNWQDIAA
tara:strand:- start:4705 stop:5508 length:804 start_codon:yes stop_codon:yes gene_type:complete